VSKPIVRLSPESTSILEDGVCGISALQLVILRFRIWPRLNSDQIQALIDELARSPVQQSRRLVRAALVLPPTRYTLMLERSNRRGPIFIEFLVPAGNAGLILFFCPPDVNTRAVAI
jgi:hypothetical protein